MAIYDAIHPTDDVLIEGGIYMGSKDEYDALSRSIAKINADAAKTAAVIAAKIEARRQNRAEMQARINKEFESVSGKPKRNLPV